MLLEALQHFRFHIPASGAASLQVPSYPANAYYADPKHIDAALIEPILAHSNYNAYVNFIEILMGQRDFTKLPSEVSDNSQVRHKPYLVDVNNPNSPGARRRLVDHVNNYFDEAARSIEHAALSLDTDDEGQRLLHSWELRRHTSYLSDTIAKFEGEHTAGLGFFIEYEEDNIATDLHYRSNGFFFEQSVVVSPFAGLPNLSVLSAHLSRPVLSAMVHQRVTEEPVLWGALWLALDEDAAWDVILGHLVQVASDMHRQAEARGDVQEPSPEPNQADELVEQMKALVGAERWNNFFAKSPEEAQTEESADASSGAELTMTVDYDILRLRQQCKPGNIALRSPLFKTILEHFVPTPHIVQTVQARSQT